MGSPSPMEVPPELEGLLEHDPEVVAALRDARITLEKRNDLNEREVELVRIAALVALGAPDASLSSHVKRARSAGASAGDVWGAVTAVATLVGVPRLVQAVPAIAAALEDD